MGNYVVKKGVFASEVDGSLLCLFRCSVNPNMAPGRGVKQDVNRVFLAAES